MADGAIDCPSCGTPITDRFCPACGEKRLDEGDLRVGHYLHEVLHGLTHANGRLPKSLRAVLRRPGELSRAYMEGRRKRYMRPVALFLVLNLVYFLLPIFETFNTSLHSQLNYQPYSRWANELMGRVVAHTGSTLEHFAASYAIHSSANAKLMLIAMVFLLAPVLGLVYFGRARYASAHVAFAFEAMIFNLLVPTILLGAFLFVVVGLFDLAGIHLAMVFDDDLLGVIGAILNLHLFFGAGRRFYGCTIAGSAWRALFAFAGLFLALNAYRLLLFLVTTLQLWFSLGRGAHH